MLRNTEPLKNLQHLGSGKVRETFSVDDKSILIVTTDRISAFDVVLPTEIPDKGAILTALSLWWFERLEHIVPNHLITTRVEDYPPQLAGLTSDLRKQSMLCRKLDIVPLECVARGYLAGSATLDYQRDQITSGHLLPAGLRDGSQLPEPIFAPATKAPPGEHDTNISPIAATTRLGADVVAELQRLTMAIYAHAVSTVHPKGLILADTKLEFGHTPDGQIYLADEALTPDSSRYWTHESWQQGNPTSFDKQIVRKWLIDHDLAGTPAPLPDHIVDLTRTRYIQAYETITERKFPG